MASVGIVNAIAVAGTGFPIGLDRPVARLSWLHAVANSRIAIAIAVRTSPMSHRRFGAMSSNRSLWAAGTLGAPAKPEVTLPGCRNRQT